MDQNQNQQPPVFNQPQGYGQTQYGQPYGQPQYSLGKPMMPFWTAVKTCFKKYFDFTGRARRSEYWWFGLFYFIVMFAWVFVAAFFMVAGMEILYDSNSGLSPMAGIYASSAMMFLPILVFIFPLYAAQTRRLHDTGHSGWWVVASLLVSLAYGATYLYMLMPFLDTGRGLDELMSSPMIIVVGILGLVSAVLGIVIFVFTVLDSQRGENKYGPSPKYQ